MKKFRHLLVIISLCVSAMSYAQLPWDTEMTSADFNNALTVISKTDNVSFSDGLFGIGGGMSVGRLVIIGNDYSDECVIALPQTGLPETLTFSWLGGGTSGTLTVYQSTDHNNWSSVWSETGKGALDLTASAATVSLNSNTKYLKFAATGRNAATFRDIKVTELKHLSASTDEWPFQNAMVDDAPATKRVTITWTNIVADITSSDPHFTVSANTVGAKNLINQTTDITISYLHTEAGSHSGTITISGEGKQVEIAVSGSTSKYDQTLAWNQDLGDCLTTDIITFNAFATSGLDVAYHSSDSTIAYYGDTQLTILKAGMVTFTAEQPGNYKYNGTETIAKTLTISKANPDIMAHADDITYGQTLAEVVLSDLMGKVPGNFSWAQEEPATVLNAGSYTLQVLFTPDNTDIYNERVVPVSLTVNKAQQNISWEGQQKTITEGETLPITATLSSSLPITYAFTSCNITIEGNNLIALEAGEVTVIAFHPGNDNYLPTTVVMQSFTVQKAPQTAIEQTAAPAQRQTRKYLRDNSVLIDTENHTYDAAGRMRK